MSNHFQSVSWLKGSNIYEVNIRQYTKEGTFQAFMQHLPRLKDMGVEVLWLMPVTPISKKVMQGTLGSYYACSSYTEVNPEYGTLNDFKDLVEAVHQRGMKIIIDWVANHTGWGHQWTKEHPDWYMKDAAGNFTEENGWKDVIDLNYDNTEMRKAMIDAMMFWVKQFDIDGFRCDMAHLVPLDFWEEARSACETVKQLYWLAECEDVQYHNVFDITYAWEWMHVSEKLMKGYAGLNHMYDVLHKYSQYPKDSHKLFFTTNHDENSWNGTEYEKYDGAAKPLAVFTATWNGIPLLYSGQELPNYKRLKFFDKDEIEWSENISLHQFYKTLLALHKTEAVADGETFILPSDHEHVMIYLRRKNDAIVLVVLNISGEERIKITVEHEWLSGRFNNLFSGLTHTLNGKEHFELMAYDFFVYEKR
jgi:glycosidase